MYANKNFRTKKALKAAVKAWRDNQQKFSTPFTNIPPPVVECHQPGPFGPLVKDGDHTCEGPHYPAAHKWYARVRVSAGRIIKVLS